jgi:2-dehydro-3-deoxyphosphogluconate aldolase / (4S)-4-hydroxy-2-oxoglutarate aldolase
VTDDEFFARYLRTPRVMAILRGYGPDRTLELCRQAWTLGIELVEIPVQSAADVESLRQAVVAGADLGRPVGAGTVVSPELVATAAAAGAAFTVAPGLDERVAATSRAAGLPHLPGVGTATEVHRALELGFTWQKAFPAAALGPGWVAAMLGPFPQVQLVATGGIDLANASSFLDAGAAAVSLGSAFATADAARVHHLTGTTPGTP